MERKETAADLNLKNLCLEKSIWARNAGFWEALSYLCRNDTSQKQVASFLSCLWACKYQTNCWIRKDCEWECEGRILCVILLKIGEDGKSCGCLTIQMCRGKRRKGWLRWNSTRPTTTEFSEYVHMIRIWLCLFFRKKSDIFFSRFILA